MCRSPSSRWVSVRYWTDPIRQSLTGLRNERTIAAQQLGNVRGVSCDGVQVMIGFTIEQITGAAQSVAFAYDQANTSKSPRKALQVTGDRGTLRLNGDVVFRPQDLDRIR